MDDITITATTKNKLGWFERWQLSRLTIPAPLRSSMKATLKQDKDAPIWEARMGNKIVGWATQDAPWDGMEDDNFSIFVQPEYRKHSVATQLAEAAFQTKGPLTVAAHDATSLHVFRKWADLGYVGTILHMENQTDVYITDDKKLVRIHETSTGEKIITPVSHRDGAEKCIPLSKSTEIDL